MAKKQKEARTDIDERLPESPTADVFDPFVGGEEDDLMDMEYVQDETTESHDTHPPQTKEEAELRASGKDQELDDPTPPKAEEDEAVAEDEAADEDGAEEDAAEPAEAVDAADDEPEDEAPKVPKDRFDEVNERMKKAERELAEIREKMESAPKEVHEEPEPEPYDYTAKEKEAAEALLEGDMDKWAEINAEIRGALREETLREAKQFASESDQQTVEQASFEETAQRVEAEYPALNADSEQYNDEIRTEMLDLYVGYARSGQYTRSEALDKAAKQAAKIYQLDKSEEPPVDDGKVVNIKQTDVKKKAKIADQQPPDIKGKAQDDSEPRHDILNMSDEEFDALPESTKRRMRGDVL